MDSDSPPKKMSGYLQAFKTSVAKIKSSSKIHHSSTITTPGLLQVIKRTGDVAAFDVDKISVAIGKAFLAVEGQQSADSSRIHDRIKHLTEMVMNTFNHRLPASLYSYDSYIIEKLYDKFSYVSETYKIIDDGSKEVLLFKKLKQITATIIFSTTRNFSIQKDLSISA